jgi:hypothetical protein
MNAQLSIAALLSATLAVSHSWLGERLILQPILGVQDLPKLSGSHRGMKKIVRFAWHITSVFFVAMAVILFYFSRVAGDQAVIRIISITYLLSAVITIVVSRGRHYAWVVFLAVGLLTWFH